MSHRQIDIRLICFSIMLLYIIFRKPATQSLPEAINISHWKTDKVSASLVDPMLFRIY